MRQHSAARLVLIAGVASVSLSASAEAPRPIPGFSLAASQVQRQTEDQLVEMLDAASTERHLRYLTEEPHPPGSERNLELARYVRDRFVEYGLEEVEILRYDVFLPLPREVRVRMVEPFEFEPSLKEDGYPVDKDSYATEVGITYISMSASGEATAPLIYAHSGNPEDYDWLEAQGIDPRGKVALVRYSMPYSYRGFKAYEAQRRGVKALLVYSDPMEDGYRRGEVFPNGPWGPESHIQRGAITYDFIVPGDPLTPGWASLEGARRIPMAEARSIPDIMAVPMSWRDARPLLESLRGPVAPHAWQGALPFTYHVGPGPAKVWVKVDSDTEIRPIWVVVGKIRGREEPEKKVIVGNHRDAWVYGAVDPSSGTASLLELARVLGQLARQGQRPRRTVVLANWDAEEVHLTGSTEWGEQYSQELLESAVAYLNVDSSASGPNFQASAVSSLNPTVVEVVRDVIDPNSRRSLLATWKKRLEKDEGKNLADADLVENTLGSGSDYTVFLNYLGVPIVDMTFNGPYGVYHSQYDDFYWMSRFGDPGFRYMTALVEVWGRMALRLANAEILPYDFELYASRVEGFLDTLAEQPGVAQNLDLTAAREALAQWNRAAERLAVAVARLLAGDTIQSRRLVELNQALLEIERQFLLNEGIPGRPWFKHALYAPRFTYAAMSLPGVTEAVEAQDWQRARDQLARLVDRFQGVTGAVQRAADLASVSK